MLPFYIKDILHFNTDWFQAYFCNVNFVTDFWVCLSYSCDITLAVKKAQIFMFDLIHYSSHILLYVYGITTTLPYMIYKMPGPFLVNAIPMMVCQIPFMVYRIPFMVYRIPFMVCRIPFMVYRIPLMVHRIPLMMYRIPLMVCQISLMVLFLYAIVLQKIIHIKLNKKCTTRYIYGPDVCWAVHKGGYRLRPIIYTDIKDYILQKKHSKPFIKSSEFNFVGHMLKSEAKRYTDGQYIHVHLPLQEHVQIIQLMECRKIAMLHDIDIGSKTSRAIMKRLFMEHVCEKCPTYITIFETLISKKEQKKLQRKKAKKKRYESVDLPHNVNKNVETLPNCEDDLGLVFPPLPSDRADSHKIITAACKRFQPELFEEDGCAVCGQLVPLSSLTKLSAMKNYLHILEAPGITRQERHISSDKLCEYPYAIDHSCQNICNLCRSSIRHSKVPKMALANGLWLGPVPEVLSSLRYIEKMLIARIRHSVCSIRIASGMRKMKAHAIAYQQPIPKIYDILPPPKADIEEVIAIMFTGPCKPTLADFKRTPFLVRRNHVKRALEWLILNHSDYEDVIISSNNLNEYPEDMPPVSIEYKEMIHNKTPESTSMHDMDEEDGTKEGDCAFTVHGLTGHELTIMTTNAVKAKALNHLNSQGKFLAIGHSEQPESIWHNPQLYPQMFPWLFPYGLGGIGTIKGISDKIHKKWLLMYHDKRFQIDHDFPFIAFSHEQIKTTSTQCFLLAEKKIFDDIKHRILNINKAVLTNIMERMSKEEFVKPQNKEEEDCFQLMKDVDHVAGPVKGSNTSKKWMRNEIWSLIYHRGAPFWYITISPADIKHPLCIYYAGKNVKFNAEILPYDEHLRLICSNPVAGARFFDFMVNSFIADILGVDAKHKGIYGDVPAYYGTVEQQGRLTLHLHMLIWLKGNLTAQEMRERILDPNSDWKKHLISWLESCHIGEFMTGTKDEVVNNVAEHAKNESYKDPTETLPHAPPQICSLAHTNNAECQKCNNLNNWWKNFENTVDDLISKSNIHNCERGSNKDGSASQKKASCKDNKYGKCKARFPRPIFKSTEVHPETGSLNIKKHEEWINFITPTLTYILRCNTDVTCMWSGTALKAVIMYVSDYITKTGLKTHVMFEAVRNIFDKHCDILGSSISEKEKARKLMNKIVNTLSTKTELGGPMVCMYLLDNPDHYTNHIYIPFFWYSFILEVQKSWENYDSTTNHTEKVTLVRSQKKIVGLSPVYDYIFRPPEFNNMNLYEWILQCRRLKYNQNTNKKTSYHNNHNDFEPHIQDFDQFDHMYNDNNNNGINNTSQNNNSIDDESEETYTEDNDESDAETIVDNLILNNLPKNMYRFTKKHPLFNSHVASFKPLKPNVVVNFIGRILPRCDQGDKEFYCLTMLTFFKPWRCGLDLKKENETWDEMFHDHVFTSREKQIMKNFNIKYECLDARDDFHAQMKAGYISNNWPMDCLDHNDDLNDTNISGDADPYVDLYADDLTEEHNRSKWSKTELRRQKETMEIRDVLHRIGWIDEKVVSDTEPKHITVNSNITAPTWKSILHTMKQDIIQNKAVLSSSSHIKNHEFVPNLVRIVNKAYLEKRFHTTEHNISMDDICNEYNLNEEQERAFRIIANHVVLPNSEPLKMYIGGMGGTGKTQVLKALSKFFEARQEAHRFIIVAPTGSAAALLSGSTYHSVFGINEMNSEAQTTKTMIQVRTRLLGVDYIFMDEVSMLSCHDMYKISAQLCRVMNKPTIPFGGLNMLFAGDFAQLPPPIGGENVALYSRIVGVYGTKTKWQEEALGRALWHQITTVVILRQNMRQTQQSKNDDKLRKALINMRYKGCTLEDIQFLRSLITSQQPNRPSITHPNFKFISIITAKNSQKDEINCLGCQKFAQATKQDLIEFFSDDVLRSAENVNNGTTHKNYKRKVTKLTQNLQKLLWRLPHSAADRPIPGKLTLCKGLPIMIKCNVATELCITNGQEGTVVGWQSTIGNQNQNILDVLFIKLISPPKNIQIKGLPINVVPLTRSTVAITCILPDGNKISISRSQVEVLPNFAMTDFASQGKTRPYNPVDLNNCRSHQAYYTALSRSSTAEGTVILQGFDTKKITGKASGALRQEFRDLELLHEITKLHYLGELNESIQGDRRNTLIHTFRQHKGLSYVPYSVHPSIRWNNNDPMLDPIADDLPWTISAKATTTHITEQNEEKGNDNKANKCNLHENVKRKETIPLEKEHKTKIKKTRSFSAKNADDINIDTQSLIPSGTTWHQNSCAYDAILCIIHSIWTSNRDKYTEIFNNMNNEIMSNLASNFWKHASRKKTLDSTRDDMRRYLHDLSVHNFGWGQFTSVYHVIKYMFTLPVVTMNYKYKCINNHISNARIPDNTCLISAGQTIYPSISEWMTSMTEETNKSCIICNERLTLIQEFTFPLPLIALDFSHQMLPLVNIFTISIENTETSYKLRGIIYFGDSHFIARVISDNDMVWFHDGITTGHNLIYEGMLNNDLLLNQCKGKNAIAAIYVMC